MNTLYFHLLLYKIFAETWFKLSFFFFSITYILASYKCTRPQQRWEKWPIQTKESQDPCWSFRWQVGRWEAETSAAEWRGSIWALPKWHQPRHWGDWWAKGTRTHTIWRLGAKRKSHWFLDLIMLVTIYSYCIRALIPYENHIFRYRIPFFEKRRSWVFFFFYNGNSCVCKMHLLSCDSPQIVICMDSHWLYM